MITGITASKSSVRPVLGISGGTTVPELELLEELELELLDELELLELDPVWLVIVISKLFKLVVIGTPF